MLYISQPNTCPLKLHTHTHTHCNMYTLHPKLAIILNPSPAWVIPDNPGLILVNSGHSSAGFTLKPQRQGGDWSDHGDRGLGVAQVVIYFFPRVFKTRPDWPLWRHTIPVQNMFSPVNYHVNTIIFVKLLNHVAVTTGLLGGGITFFFLSFK